MNSPTWAMTAVYSLHLFATVAWVGALISVAVIFIPVGRKRLSPEAYAAFFDGIVLRIQQIGWLSLFVLTGTGMFQMSAAPQYEGFLAIGSPWATAILLKHLVIGGMVGVGVYQTWFMYPALRRSALLRAAGKSGTEAEYQRLLIRESRLMTANLILAALVLVFTAWARVS